MDTIRKDFDIKQFLLNNILIILILVMFVYVGLNSANFFKYENFKNIASNTSVRFIIALGISGCLITKGTDLAAGRIIGLGACISVTLLQDIDATEKFFSFAPLSIPAALLITVGICVIFGLISGIIISYFNVPPFIATLGMQLIVYGTNLIFTKAEPLGRLSKNYSKVATKSIGETPPFIIPYVVIYATIIAFIMFILYNYTKHGKHMYAVGGNENAAEVSGINVKLTKILIYALAAGLYALAGFLLASKSGGASVNTGNGYELEAIAACTIGGVSTGGGVGRVSGVLVGVLIFELLKTSLQYLKVDPSIQFVIQGIIIIVAVALDLRKNLAKK